MENGRKKCKDKPLIPERVFLVGEGRIPSEVIEKTKDEHLKIFLREPNPNNWPKEIAHFTRYLPEKERIKWKVVGILRKHEGIINNELRSWATRIRQDMASEEDLLVSNLDVVLQEVERYLSSLIRDTLFHDTK